ncbi:MAG: response regulator transcription factor [Lactimicrobium sp.]|jgi:two-component system KDP operon response regulator KdpE|uniref:response regulator transcription factor n=1 Tax=Lactimicrobium sp. TaxID=2563780 RepID=UPI002F353F05
MNSFKILIVEDDQPVMNLIATTLKVHDYAYLMAHNGKEAISLAASSQPDLVLLDLGLPDIDGMDVIASIRSWSQMPIIVISARGEDADKIAALDAGADDYLTKPFSVEELLARIRTTQRRLNYASVKHEDSIFTDGALRIDYAAASVTLHDKPVHLTPIEYKLLVLLSKNVGKVLTHAYIIRNIWGTGVDTDIISLRVYMASLRKKLNDPDLSEPYIQTHIGIGYSMSRVE